MIYVMTVAAMALSAIAAAQNASSADATSQPFRPPMSAEELIVEPSPEVASMPPVRVAEVDLASGQASLSVPLLQWQVGSTAVNIGLSYRVGAFTTEDEAGWIGLGWNLQGAGAVTRNIAGLPDEYKEFDLRKPSEADTDYYDRLLNYHTDASLDRYSYSCPGGSGQFIITPGGDIRQLPSSNNRIELIGDKREGVRDFRITTPDGSRYEFTEREHVEYRYLPANLIAGTPHPSYNGVSAWLLKQIITPEGADTIRYEYEAMPWHSRFHNRPSSTLTVRDDQMAMHTPSGWKLEYLSGGVDDSYNINQSDFHDQKILKRVISRTASAEFGYESPSQHEKYISSVILRDHSGQTVRKASLKGDNAPTRRKLEAVTITDADGGIIDHNEFTYTPDNVHNFGDFYGYPNAWSYEPYTPATMLDQQTLGVNPRRRPSFAHAVAGTMKSSLSATGVLTEYEYEPNSIARPTPPKRSRTGTGPLLPVDTLIGQKPYPPVDPPLVAEQDTTLTIGIRLKSITQTDRITGSRIMREYTYADGICNVDFNRLSISDFIAISGLQWFYAPHVYSQPSAKVYDSSSTLLFGSRLPGYRPESARIFYGKVHEFVSGTGIEQPLLTEYVFDLSRCPLAFIAGGSGGFDTSFPSTDKRSLLPTFFPAYGPESYRRRFGQFTVNGYFREHIGAQPELSQRTIYRWQNGRYTHARTDRHFHITADSICVTTGLHYESLVRQVKNPINDFIQNDLRSLNEISSFNIAVEASIRVTDSIATTVCFPNGSERVQTTRLTYNGLRVHSGSLIPLDSITIQRPEIIFPDLPEIRDSITHGSDLLVPIGVTLREGGHSVRRSVSYSDMVSTRFFRQACDRGLRMLPVREQWIIDGTDTLTRSYAYGLIPTVAGTLTRLSEIATEVNGARTETVTVAGYSPHGLPEKILRTGRPASICTWDAADQLRSVTIADVISDPALTLTTAYDYRQLTGCTRITYPSGRIRTFDYTGGRLSSESDSHGRVVASYGYEFHCQTQGQFAGQNRITTTSHIAPAVTSTAAQLFDGFGRVIATVGEGQGGDGSDVVSVYRFDALGRPVTEWAAMALTADQVKDAMKRDTPLLLAAREQLADAAAYSSCTYPEGEASQTPATATIAGEAFADHPALSLATCSNPADGERRVVRWRWDGASLRADGFYSAGELDAVRSVDGDGRVSLVFTDCMGRTVLQRSVADGSDGSHRFADTYTVSDPWGNPLLVIPPEASERLGSSGSLSLTQAQIAALLDDYAFIYRYDRRLRLRSKKLPGCAEVRFAYDSANRLAFTRDGNQAQQGRRSFMLYDPLGRPALTGTCRDALSESFWSDNAPDSPAMVATASAAVGSASSLCRSGYMAADSVASLLAEPKLLTATFYDSYTPVATRLSVRPPAGVNPSPKGLTTATLTAVLGPGADTIAPLLSVTFYDADERPVMTVSDTHRGEQLQTLTDYNLAGQPVKVGTALLGASAATPLQSMICTTAYDRHGRPTGSTLNYAGRTFNLGTTAYDRLGRPASVTSHGDITRSFTYDLHGWLTEWSCKDLTQRLSYANGTNPSYTGRISAKSTQNGGSLISTYNYSYDQLGRLISADYKQSSVTNPGASTLADYSTAYTYDLQGNILTLERKGPKYSNYYGIIDDIKATYQGNQIATLCDDASTVLFEASLDLPNGSWSGSDFEYDRNGNQTRDLSRGVADIQYNELNLPERVEVDGGGSIEYLYTAAGTKLAEIVREEDDRIINRRDYVGAFEYEADSIVRIALESGYVTVADTVYHLYAPDYQGNIVAVYNTKTGSQEHYKEFYPYGLPHAPMPKSSSITPGFPSFPGLNPGLGPGLGPIIIKPSDPEPEPSSTNRRWYGSKELTTEHGLNAYDFEARWLAPAFSRFTTPDPMATEYLHFSPYIYCSSDPINLIDPTGMNIWSVDPYGNTKLVEETKEYDRFILVDENGENRKDDNGNDIYIQFQFGTVSEVKNENGYDRIAINGNQNGKSLFEFLANNISVNPNEIEFSWLAPRESKTNRTNYIYTSHESRADGGMIKHYHWMLKHKKLFDIYSFTHSHPESDYPSKADTNIAYMLSENNYRGFIHPTNCYIYHVTTKRYIPYRGVKPNDKDIHKVSY